MREFINVMNHVLILSTGCYSLVHALQWKPIDMPHLTTRFDSFVSGESNGLTFVSFVLFSSLWAEKRTASKNFLRMLTLRASRSDLSTLTAPTPEDASKAALWRLIRCWKRPKVDAKRAQKKALQIEKRRIFLLQRLSRVRQISVRICILYSLFFSLFLSIKGT